MRASHGRSIRSLSWAGCTFATVHITSGIYSQQWSAQAAELWSRTLFSGRSHFTPRTCCMALMCWLTENLARRRSMAWASVHLNVLEADLKLSLWSLTCQSQIRPRRKLSILIRIRFMTRQVGKLVVHLGGATASERKVMIFSGLLLEQERTDECTAQNTMIPRLK